MMWPFKPKVVIPKPTGAEIRFTKNGWGHAIYVTDQGLTPGRRGHEYIKGHGFSFPRPRLGDNIVLTLRDGEEISLRVTEIRLTMDPDDMFFYTALLDDGTLDG